MSALILSMPDFVLTRHAAREVLYSPGATDDQMLLACDALDLSDDWTERRIAAETRQAIYRGQKVQRAANDLARRLTRPTGCVGPLHEARVNAETRACYLAGARRIALLVLTITAAGIVFASIMAAPAKSARTIALYHQIEELNHE